MNTKAGTHRKMSPAFVALRKGKLVLCVIIIPHSIRKGKMSKRQASGLWQDKNYVTAWKRDWYAGHPENRDRNNRRMRQQRNEFLNQLTADMGGRCQRCGYDACAAALDYHHVNSQEKNALVSHLANQRKWNDAITEANKCILLCGNCHREYEHGYWTGEFVKRDGIGWTLASWEPCETPTFTPFQSALNGKTREESGVEQLLLPL